MISRDHAREKLKQFMAVYLRAFPDVNITIRINSGR
jgi:hypothetical protein